jgi:hypothetical protein
MPNERVKVSSGGVPAIMTSTGEHGLDAIPEIIRAGGDGAVRAYWEFLDDPVRSNSTRKLYRNRTAAFFRWAESRGLKLESIDLATLLTYKAEIGVAKSSHEATLYLTPVRGVLGRMASAGVLATNPCPKAQPNGRTNESTTGRLASRITPAKPEQEPAVADDGRFPILSLMAMLANMAEKSLEVIFRDDVTAGKLLEFVRWRDGRECIQCRAEDDDPPDAPAPEGGRYQCPACGCNYAVTDGTPFEGLAVPLRHALFLLFSLYLRGSRPLSHDAIARELGLNAPDVEVVVSRIEEALAREGLTSGDELRQAVARKNREMTQDEVARDIIEYGELTNARDELLRAKSEGSPVADLPAGMTIDEAIAIVDAKLAEHDRYVIANEDGYLVQGLAEPPDGEPAAAPQASVPSPAVELSDES